MDYIVLQGLIKKYMVIINSQEMDFTESKNHFYRCQQKNLIR